MRVYRKAYCLIGFFSIYSFFASGQNQRLADSLIILYQSGTYEEDERILLRKIAENEQRPDRKLAYANLLIEKAATDSILEFLHSGYLQKGNAMQLQGNYVPALNAFLTSLNFANRLGDNGGIGVLLASIANTYSRIGNSGNAMDYYHKAINLARKNKDSITLGSALINAGDEFVITKNYDSALVYFKESGHIFNKINYPIGTAYNLGNIGMVHAALGEDELAENHINESITMLEELEDYYPISVYLTYMSDIYARQQNFARAFGYAERSLELAAEYGLKEQISAANLTLSELHEQAGNDRASLKHYKEHVAYRDSVKNIESVQQMADLRTNYEVSQKQVEVDLLNQQKKNQKTITIATSIGLFLIGLLAFSLFRRNKYIQKTKKVIEMEKKRSDKLLLNILPEETAQELKEHGSVEAKRFESVTVLFTDFEGFTNYAEKLSPEQLVKSVDFYFSKFDEIIERYGLEKIKTIGDAYMAAGGLHANMEAHAVKMVYAAFDILEFVQKAKANGIGELTKFDIRIGINTGPIVAGVVGTTKFSYDIWGDTVNVASRMESMSQKGKINISETTYALIKDFIDCEYRGEIAVKNRGKMKMYFVKKRIDAVQPLADT